MEPTKKAAAKRHPLTGAGIVVAFIGALLFVIPMLGGRGGSFGAVLLVLVGAALMIAGWMIRMRQAAEHG